MWTLEALNLVGIEERSRRHARRAGFRPRTRLSYHVDWDRFVEVVRDLQLPGGRLRGMAARGHDTGQRHVWVATHATYEGLTQTLTHEMAHCLLPWREHHTARWLDVHVAVSAEVSTPAHADQVAAEARVQYGLDPTVPLTAS